MEAINKGAAPNVSSAWDNVVKSEINKSYDKARAYAKKAFGELQLPMDTVELFTQFDVRMLFK